MSFGLFGASSDAVVAYRLGQQAAEVDAIQQRALQRIFNRGAGTVSAADLAAQNQALAAENHQLRSQLEHVQRELARCERFYAELDAWADSASQKLKRHGL